MSASRGVFRDYRNPSCELPVYQTRVSVESPQGIAVHAQSNCHACIWDHADARNGCFCRSTSQSSSGRWGTAALSALATSAYPYFAIDRRGTCSPYERFRVDSATAAAGPASAGGTPHRIQVLLDKNRNASRQQLEPQIHAISGETHREIHALLNDHQKRLERAMQQREHGGEENRRPAAGTE